MNMANITVHLDCTPEEKTTLAKGGDPLRALCRKEVESFDRFLQEWGADQLEGADYAQGLAKWERSVVEGFLYQKLLERF